MGNPSRKILEELKESLIHMMSNNYFNMDNKPIKFKTNNYEIRSVTRLPNEKEKIEFIQGRLKTLYLLKEIDKDQYKTARRQCINDRESVLRFISKIEGQENICKQFYDYCNTEHDYIEATCKVTFNNIGYTVNNIGYTVVDIDLNK